MTTRIHCDACSCPLERDDAVVVELDSGETAYFCSETCAETAECIDPDAEGPSENRTRVTSSER